MTTTAGSFVIKAKLQENDRYRVKVREQLSGKVKTKRCDRATQILPVGWQLVTQIKNELGLRGEAL